MKRMFAGLALACTLPMLSACGSIIAATTPKHTLSMAREQEQTSISTKVMLKKDARGESPGADRTDTSQSTWEETLPDAVKKALAQSCSPTTEDIERAARLAGPFTPIIVALGGIAVNAAATEMQDAIADAIEKYQAAYDAKYSFSVKSGDPELRCVHFRRTIVEDKQRIDAFHLIASLQPSADGVAMKLRPEALLLQRAAAKTDSSGSIGLKVEIKIDRVFRNKDGEILAETLAHETLTGKATLPKTKAEAVWMLRNPTEGHPSLSMPESAWFPRPPTEGPLTVTVAVAESGLGAKELKRMGKLIDENRNSFRDAIKEVIDEALKKEQSQ